MPKSRPKAYELVKDWRREERAMLRLHRTFHEWRHDLAVERHALGPRGSLSKLVELHRVQPIAVTTARGFSHGERGESVNVWDVFKYPMPDPSVNRLMERIADREYPRFGVMVRGVSRERKQHLARLLGFEHVEYVDWLFSGKVQLSNPREANMLEAIGTYISKGGT